VALQCCSIVLPPPHTHTHTHTLEEHASVAAKEPKCPGWGQNRPIKRPIQSVAAKEPKCPGWGQPLRERDRESGKAFPGWAHPGAGVSCPWGCVLIVYIEGHRAKPLMRLDRRAPKGRRTRTSPVVPHPESLAAPRNHLGSSRSTSKSSRIISEHRPGGLPIRYTGTVLLPRSARPEFCVGIGVLPGPATESHIVNRRTQ